MIRTTGSTKPDLAYRYDSNGNRIEKIIKPKSGTGGLLPEEYWSSTLYVRGADGQVLATYAKDYDRPIVNGSGIVPDLTQYQNDVYVIREGSGVVPPNDPSGVPELGFTGGSVPPGGTGNEFGEIIKLNEIYLYGRERIGLERKDELTKFTLFTANFVNDKFSNVLNIEHFDLYKIETAKTRQLGDKQYELVNHLGNILQVISDKLIPSSTNGTDVDFFEADILNATDYYPFGMEMPNRQFSSTDYDYGFNGKENDQEWGTQLVQDYGFRLYNPAIGKFLSVDPYARSYAMLTPYQFASNSPVTNIDLDGLEKVTAVDHSFTYEDLKNPEISTDKKIEHINFELTQIVHKKYGAEAQLPTIEYDPDPAYSSFATYVGDGKVKVRPALFDAKSDTYTTYEALISVVAHEDQAFQKRFGECFSDSKNGRRCYHLPI